MEAEKKLVTCCSTILFTLLDMRRELTDRKVKGRCFFCHSLGLFMLVSEISEKLLRDSDEANQHMY